MGVVSREQESIRDTAQKTYVRSMIHAAASAIKERGESVKSAVFARKTSKRNLERGAEEVLTAKRIGDGCIRGNESGAVGSPYDCLLHGLYEVEVSRIDINQWKIQVCALGANVRGFYNCVPCNFI